MFKVLYKSGTKWIFIVNANMLVRNWSTVWFNRFHIDWIFVLFFGWLRKCSWPKWRIDEKIKGNKCSFFFSTTCKATTRNDISLYFFFVVFCFNQLFKMVFIAFSLFHRKSLMSSSNSHSLALANRHPQLSISLEGLLGIYLEPLEIAFLVTLHTPFRSRTHLNA